jgi:hypothetical protein
MKKIINIVLLLIILSVFSFGQEFAPVGTAVAQFLEINLGARGTAMGHAYTTLSENADAVFWNPAGLANVQNGSFVLDYTKWPADIGIGGFSAAMTFGNVGTFSVNGAYLMTDDMEITTVDQPDGTGETFGITNYAFGLSYARNLTENLSVGLTAKIVSEKYFDNGYTGFALDLGTLYKTGFRGLKIGMSILHFGPEVQFDGDYIDYSDPDLAAGTKKDFEQYSLPITFRVGASMDVWESEENKIISALDMVHTNNNLEQYNFGFEYGYDNLIFFRGGYRFNLDEGGVSFGAGVNYELFENNKVALNYSFADKGIVASIHRFSAGFSF